MYPALLIATRQLHFVFVEGEMFLVCIYFSLFYGFGSGLVLRAGVTFGGTDTIARILNRRVLRKLPLSRRRHNRGSRLLVFCWFWTDASSLCLGWSSERTWRSTPL